MHIRCIYTSDSYIPLYNNQNNVYSYIDKMGIFGTEPKAQMIDSCERLSDVTKVSYLQLRSMIDARRVDGWRKYHMSATESLFAIGKMSTKTSVIWASEPSRP